MRSTVHGGDGVRDFCPKCFRSVADALKCVAPLESPSTDELDKALCDATLEVERLKAALKSAEALHDACMGELATVSRTRDELHLNALAERDSALEDLRCVLGYLGKKALKKFSVEITEIELRWAEHFEAADDPIMSRWIRPEED